MSEKKLAIVVPVKDREAYLEVFLEAIPRYLEEVNHLHDFKIFVAEQVDDAPFNLSLSRNVGARFALDEDRYDYLIFHDVDLIPIENVDYGYREKNVCWFMKAGTCKIHRQALIDANGYNPSIWGWCSEDYEFYRRVADFGHPLESWHQISESRGAVIVDLDLSPRTREECAEHSKWYFGHDGVGPSHISYNLTDQLQPRLRPVRRIRHRRAAEARTYPKTLIPATLAAEPGVLLTAGNHQLLRADGMPFADRTSTALRLGHFPVRSTDQLRAKILVNLPRHRANPEARAHEGFHWDSLWDRCAEGTDLSAGELAAIAVTYGGDVPSDIVLDPVPFEGSVRYQTRPAPVPAAPDRASRASK